MTRQKTEITLIHDDQPDGQRAVTLQDIAERCLVSKMTVSRALRGDRAHISDVTYHRVLAVANELGYDPTQNHAARRLALRKSGQQVLNHVCALFFPRNFHHFNYFNAIFRGIMDVMVDEQYGLLSTYAGEMSTLGGTSNPRASLTDVTLPHIFRRGDVDGAIVLSNAEHFQPMMQMLRKEANFGNRPLISVIERIAECSSVVADEWQGGYDTIAHLLGLGHRRILLYDSARGSRYSRMEGHRQAVLDAGLDVNEVLINGRWIMVDMQDTEEVVTAKLAGNPDITAIVAPNDWNARVIIEILSRRGLRVPTDMSVTGYDDVDPIFDETGNNILTTVRQPLTEIGREAAQLMMRLLNNGDNRLETVTLSPELVVRKSTAEPRNRSL